MFNKIVDFFKDTLEVQKEQIRVKITSRAIADRELEKIDNHYRPKIDACLLKLENLRAERASKCGQIEACLVQDEYFHNRKKPIF